MLDLIDGCSGANRFVFAEANLEIYHPTRRHTSTIIN